MTVDKEQVLDFLKDEKRTYDDIKRVFGVSKKTAWRKLSEISNDYDLQSKTIDKFGTKAFTVEPEGIDSPSSTEGDMPRAMTRGDKQRATEETRKTYNRMAKAIEDLKKRNPYPDVKYTPDDEGESAVLYTGDIHFGSIVEDDEGNEIYNSEIAEKKIQTMYENTTKVTEMVERYHDLDAFHIAFLGDIIENDMIYEQQKYEIDERPLEQVQSAVESFVPFIKKYSEDFGEIYIHSVTGNHGRVSDEAHEDDNFDNVFYQMLKLGLSDADNIHFDIGKGGWNDFEVCGKKIGITHGKDLHHQGSTSAGEDKFLTHMTMRDLDELHLGHYHERKAEEVLGDMAYWNGAIKPPGQYADHLGTESVPTQTLMTYHEDKGTTGIFYIDLRTDEENQKL